jgi:hypothetical protein
MRMLRIAAITLAVGIFGLLLLCVSSVVYPELQPTAVQQLLRIANLPTDLQLPPQNLDRWDEHDFSSVKEALLRDVPLGTPRSDIMAFLTAHGQHCDQQPRIISCQLESQRFPCRTTNGVP